MIRNWTLQPEGEVMKTSTIKFLSTALILASGAICMTGCAKSGLEADLLAPPGYSSSENFHRQLRAATFDQQQLIDDFDRDVVMSRPPSNLTKWHIYQSD